MKFSYQESEYRFVMRPGQPGPIIQVKVGESFETFDTALNLSGGHQRAKKIIRDRSEQNCAALNLQMKNLVGRMWIYDGRPSTPRYDMPSNAEPFI